MARRLLALPVGLVLAGGGAGIVGGAFAAVPAGAAQAPTPVFNSIASPVPVTSWSQALGAGYTITQFGAEVTVTSTAQPLASVSTVLESFACENGKPYTSTTCQTGPNATFPVPITATLYNVNSAGTVTLTTPIATTTATFTVPFRPSYNSSCGPTKYGARWRASTGTCAYALADPVTFSHFPANVTLPSKFVVTFSYKSVGPAATGLNIALDSAFVTATPYFKPLPPSVGTEGYVYLSSTNTSLYKNNTTLAADPTWNPTTIGKTAKPDITVSEVTPTPVPPPVTSSSSTHGYYEVASDGGLFAFTAPFHGSMGGKMLNSPIVGMAQDPATGGYWEVASDGGIFAFTAPFYGSMGGKMLNEPIVGMAAMPTGKGYYEVASDGGIFAFGTAKFHGSMGGKMLNKPIVGMTFDPTTGGYWEVASDGGLFSFTAPFKGSMGGKALNAPIVGMALDSSTGGYYEVASDGGLFAFTAPFKGSMGGKMLNKPIVGMNFDSTTGGYYEVASDGGLFAFTAPFKGSMGGKMLNKPIVGMTSAS